MFKPLIGDRLIFPAESESDHGKQFYERTEFSSSEKDASKLIVSELESRLKKTVMHKELGRQVSYQYLIRLEAYKLIKHLIGEKEYEGFRIWW